MSISPLHLQRQFPPGWPGTFIRASRPRFNTSCNGAIASAARDSHATLIRAGPGSPEHLSDYTLWLQVKALQQAVAEWTDMPPQPTPWWHEPTGEHDREQQEHAAALQEQARERRDELDEFMARGGASTGR